MLERRLKEAGLCIPAAKKGNIGLAVIEAYGSALVNHTVARLPVHGLPKDQWRLTERRRELLSKERHCESAYDADRDESLGSEERWNCAVVAI